MIVLRPDPARGGAATHAWELLAQASRTHRLTLFSAGIEPGETPAELAALGVDAVGVSWQRHAPASRPALLWEAVRGPGSADFRAVMPAVEALGEALAHAERRQRFDLVFVWGSDLAPLLGQAQAPTAYYVTDAYTTYFTRMVRSAAGARHRLLYALDAAHVRRWERTRYGDATALAATSRADANVLEDLIDRPFDVVPVTLGDRWFAVPDVDREPDLVAIIAGLDYWPNVDAVQWFLGECWPRIAAGAPAARFVIVGRSPAPELRTAIQGAGIELLADVPDARPYYWRAGTVVIPLRVGSGVKNQLLHAFATGAPVVGTTVAIEGTTAAPGVHALVEDDPVPLADAVLQSIRQRDAAGRRANAARAIADEYRAGRTTHALEAFWHRAAARPGVPSAPSGDSPPPS
jgi:glycosyltransferase involved in cell wall biosynthesis